MIYLTGDTHAEFARFTSKKMKAKSLNLTADDYIIICGDFGLCWKKDSTFEYYCKVFAEKPYTLLWVQGNHENYDMISEYPIEVWHGGKVRHIVRNKIILLERGQIFEIDGKTFFTFGGASSHDIQGGVLDRNDIDFDYFRRKAIDSELPFRILHESWWPQELPSLEEMEEGKENLSKVNYRVDYVITHCCATSLHKKLEEPPIHVYEADYLTDYFQSIEEKLQYKHWYFGHYHMDRDIDENHTLLYHGIISLGDRDIDLSRVPVIGCPRYQRGDPVRFKWSDTEKVGKICTVDVFGTSEQIDEPSYDIIVEEDNSLYKHICESEVLTKVLNTEI